MLDYYRWKSILGMYFMKKNVVPFHFSLGINFKTQLAF